MLVHVSRYVGANKCPNASENDVPHKAGAITNVMNSFTVSEWCEYRRISRAMLYKLLAAGLGPATYFVGNRRYVSSEADAAWLAAREIEALETDAA